MADVLCRVCGEAWDTHHLRHDAAPWVNALVLAGAGCESCEGVSPEGVNADQVAEISDQALVFDGAIDSDPLTVRPAIAGAETPRWQRPADELVWQCAGCEVSIYRDQDWREGSDFAFQVRGCNAYHQQRTLGIEREDTFPSLESARDEISANGSHCRLCAHTCRDCSRVIIEGEDFSAAPPDDPYAANASVCEECFSALEYEQAIESYSQRGLIDALGYSRNSPVWEWFDNRDTTSGTISFQAASDLGIVEIEGDRVLYMVPNRYKHLIDTPENRKQRARILWELRGIVNAD